MNEGILINYSTGPFCGSQGGLGLLSRRASGGIVVRDRTGGSEGGVKAAPIQRRYYFLRKSTGTTRMFTGLAGCSPQ